MMDTLAAFSDLLTEFNARKQTITNAVDKSALVKDIDSLERAWNSGNAGDAKKHATNVQRFAKKHKNKFTDSFWRKIESISSGNSVPQKKDSSTRPTSKDSRRGSEETATSKGYTTKQPVKSKPQNEKESEQERAMEVQGIKFKAQQLPSEKNMAQQLQVIRNRIEELAAAMRPHSNDVKNSNSKSEDCNTLVEIILNQSAELLNVYRQEKASCNRIHVEHATIRQGLKPICDAFINANTEKMETINMIEELGKCLKAKYVRISDTENRLKEMFKNATGREYKGPGNKGGKGKKENQTGPVEVFQQLINDMNRQLVDYTSQQDKIHKDNVKPKQELEHLQKRMTDTQERLREMFQHVTGREYKGPSISDGKGKTKENQYNTVEELHQMISDMDKQLVDYTSDGMVSGRKAYRDDQQPSAGMVSGRKALVDQKHQCEIEGHIQLDLIRQRLKPICAEVLNVDTDDMDTLQMIECLGKCLKKQNVRTQLATPQDSVQQQLKLEREAWLIRIKDTEDKLKEMVEQVTQLKKAAVGSKFK